MSETRSIEYCISYAGRHGSFQVADATKDLTQLLARIATLESSQLEHEEDCAVLPEGVSVTVYVTQLRVTIALQAEAIEQARKIIELGAYDDRARSWLSAHPAPVKVEAAE